MTNKIFLVLMISATCMISGSTVFAQDSRVLAAAGDRYVISAKAGGVNYTEGNVAIARTDGTGGHLIKGDDVQIGERVATGASGRAEVLLNPGSYMRLGGDSEFEFVSTSLDDLKLNLFKGSAIFEVIADDDFRVSVKTPKSGIDLIRSGVYRIDVLADGTSKLFVLKGKAYVGSGNKTEVKAGRSASIDGSSATVAKFDRDHKDPLESWSKDRAKELAKANASLQRRTLRDSLINGFNSRSWNLYDSFGLWIMNPMGRGWCFMPFGSGWGSPYGYWYGSDFWGLGMPRWIYYQPPPVYRLPTATPPQDGSARRNPVTRNPNPPARTGDDSERRGRIPAFMKIENSQRGSGDGVVNRRIDMPRGDDGGNRRMPSIPSAPPTVSQPSISLPTNSGDTSPNRRKP